MMLLPPVKKLRAHQGIKKAPQARAAYQYNASGVYQLNRGLQGLLSSAAHAIYHPTKNLFI
ncbi:hypothetical protein [Paenibacillus plantiphilus]|uniref:hypothetical protein n=1 Tax=Paenibacillus plantiphilus TaxID=2905650 RepID=UPI001F1B6AF8|nr:hypothetical protein [Paenibacillus plantiphilus]